MKRCFGQAIVSATPDSETLFRRLVDQVAVKAGDRYYPDKIAAGTYHLTAEQIRGFVPEAGIRPAELKRCSGEAVLPKTVAAHLMFASRAMRVVDVREGLYYPKALLPACEEASVQVAVETGYKVWHTDYERQTTARKLAKVSRTIMFLARLKLTCIQYSVTEDAYKKNIHFQWDGPFLLRPLRIDHTSHSNKSDSSLILSRIGHSHGRRPQRPIWHAHRASHHGALPIHGVAARAAPDGVRHALAIGQRRTHRFLQDC